MTTTVFSIHLGRQKLGGPCPITSYTPVFVKSDRAAQSTFHLRAKLNISMKSKVIHPKQYKHLKKGAHQSHLGRQKMGWLTKF